LRIASSSRRSRGPLLSAHHLPPAGQPPVFSVVQVRLVSPFALRSIVNLFFVGTDSDSTRYWFAAVDSAFSSFAAFSSFSDVSIVCRPATLIPVYSPLLSVA